MIRTIAPAKINWTLEVLGKRPDGYHEIRSVMQTIDLCDEITLEVADALSLDMTGAHSASDDDHTLAAARLLGRATGKDLPARIHAGKRIPVGAGLGGGSSDAAAVLRGLDRLWELGLHREGLAPVAGEIGADVTFFLSGGTALAEGRGERITPLPDAPFAWLIVVAPPIRIPEKTKRMYEALRATDFSDGRRTEALAERLRQGERVRGEDLFNAFERVAYETFAGLASHRDKLRDAGAKRVQVAGAGPAVFAVSDSREEADGVAGGLAGSEARVFVARTLGAAEATRVEVE